MFERAMPQENLLLRRCATLERLPSATRVSCHSDRSLDGRGKTVMVLEMCWQQLCERERDVVK